MVAVVLAGCGGGDDGGGGGAQSAQSAVQSYVDAWKNADFQQICDLLSDQFRQQLGGDNCPRFVKAGGIQQPDLQVIAVHENGDRATARLKSGGESGKPAKQEISLVRQDGDWRIASVHPAGGYSSS
jgi:ketosteroid isomerase-like protein